MKRRELMLMLGGALGVPRSPRAQEKATPVIGILGANTAEIPAVAANLAAFRQGLAEAGYVEGRNVTIEYRWAERQPDRLPGLAADLIGRNVDVIVTEGGNSATLAAKTATSTIPVVFQTGDDPVAQGLVASLARPGSNLTGVNLMSGELIPKLLELLLEVVPEARLIGVLRNQTSPLDLQEAAGAKGVQLHILQVATLGEVDAAFATLVGLQPDGLIVYSLSRARIAVLALRHSVPAIALYRDFPEAGGLMSYGASIPEGYRIRGTYAGRILKAEKPADLPIQQPTTFELVINLKTAQALGLSVPSSILARADEVIE